MAIKCNTCSVTPLAVWYRIPTNLVLTEAAANLGPRTLVTKKREGEVVLHVPYHFPPSNIAVTASLKLSSGIVGRKEFCKVNKQ